MAGEWNGKLNLSAYDDVERLDNYSTQAELAAYRSERLAKSEEMVEFIRKQITQTSGVRVVEVGSGSSALLYALEQQGVLGTSVGIDLSRSRHEFAERWRVEGGFQKVKNIQGSFADVQLEDRAFDLFLVVNQTFCLLAPENDAYPDLLLKTAHHALRRGGIFIVEIHNLQRALAKMPDGTRSFWHELPQTNPVKFAMYRQDYDQAMRVIRSESVYIFRDSREKRKVEFLRFYSKADLCDLIERNGFTRLTCYGDYSSNPFREDESEYLIVVAEKN